MFSNSGTFQNFATLSDNFDGEFVQIHMYQEKKVVSIELPPYIIQGSSAYAVFETLEKQPGKQKTVI